MWCSKCGGTDHYAARCLVVAKPTKEPKQHAPKVKKPWVKPTLTKIHLIPAVSLTETKAEAIERLNGGNVSLTGNVGFDRKKYQRELMRRRRLNHAD